MTLMRNRLAFISLAFAVLALLGVATAAKPAVTAMDRATVLLTRSYNVSDFPVWTLTAIGKPKFDARFLSSYIKAAIGDDWGSGKIGDGNAAVLDVSQTVTNHERIAELLNKLRDEHAAEVKAAESVIDRRSAKP